MTAAIAYSTSADAAVTRAEAPALWLWVAAGVALVFGLYGRFKGLGAAPLGVDEFYITRSVENVLQYGLPQFPCGGYYVRGLTYQYPVAMLRLVGFGPEVAGRLVPAFASLAVLPAAYILGRDLHSRTLGVLSVIVLALSVWEIEIARFARMYAPFQAVFAWYLICFLRYTTTGDRRALFGMIALSLAGILTWEGGALIGVLNLLPPLLRSRNGRLQRADFGYLAGMAVLLGAMYFGGTTDLRTLSSVPPYPPGVSLDLPKHVHGLPVSDVNSIVTSWWGALALIPLALSVLAFKWLASKRERWLAMAALAGALVAAAAHQFLVVAALIGLALLAGLIEREELRSRDARLYAGALCAWGLFWILFESMTIGSAETVLRALLGFPNVIDGVFYPLARTVPVLFVGLIVALGVLAAASVASKHPPPTIARHLLIATCVMLLAVGATNGARHETRYIFFLYPALIVLTGAALAWLLERRGIQATAVTLGAAMLACFFVSGDFRPSHVVHVGSTDVIARVGLRPAVAEHYYVHNDVRSAATWLSAHVTPGTLVLNGVPSLDAYYPDADYFFLDDENVRYAAYACDRGAKDRWTDTPLLSSSQQLAERVASRKPMFLILYPDIAQRVTGQARSLGWHYREAWSSLDGGVRILALNGP